MVAKMAESYKVTTEPTKLREYESKHGPLVVWSFDLEGQGSVELHKKPGNEPPAVNTMILVEDRWQGDFNGEPFTRIKLANEGGSFGGGAPRGRSPDQTRAIQRQHSQEMAIRAMSLMAQLPRRDETPWSKDSVLHNIKELTDWFERDIGGES